MAYRSIGAGLALAVTLVTQALTASEAHAQSMHIGPALEALARGDSGAAEAGFERVLHDRRALAADVTEAHRQLAALRLAAGDNASGEEHAAAAVAIDPAINPPDNATDGVRAMFTRARQEQQGQRATVEITMPEHITATRVSIGRLRAVHVPRNFGARVGVRCIADGNVIASRDFDASARTGEFSIDAQPANATVRCVAILATNEGVVFDRRSANATVESRRGGGGIFLAVGGAAIGVALIVTVVILATSSGDDPNQRVLLGAPRIVP